MLFKKTLTSFIALAACGLSMTAMAAMMDAPVNPERPSSTPERFLKPSRSGLYTQFNIGYANQNGAKGFEVGSFDLTHSRTRSFAWDAYFGYLFKITPKSSAGFELGYGDYGSVKWQDDTNDAARISQTAWLAQLVYDYAWKKNIDLFAKVGAALGRTNINTDGGIGTTPNTLTTDTTETNQNHWNTRPMFTLGITYNFMYEMGATFMWEHIFGNDVKTDNTDRFQTVDAFMLGLQYRFDF